MNNPDWIREELILALDLYFDLDYGQMHGRHPKVVSLSKELRNMKFHKEIPDPTKFRSINSVSLKLNNLKKLDRNFAGKAAANGGKLEQDIWNEFYRHRDKLKREATLIRILHLDSVSGTLGEITGQITDELLYQVHQNKELDPIARRLKLSSMVGSAIICDVCKFNPEEYYGEIGRGMLEIHYEPANMLDLGLLGGSVQDFIVVCPNCHAVLNRHYRSLVSKDLKQVLFR